MIIVLHISLAVCSSTAILMSFMLIYHDITDKAGGNIWERLFTVFLEACQLGLSGACEGAVVHAIHWGNDVYWFDVVALCNLQLFLGTNVEPLPSSNSIISLITSSDCVPTDEWDTLRFPQFDGLH
jgi:hypothetical protein